MAIAPKCPVFRAFRIVTKIVLDWQQICDRLAVDPCNK
jgi:hypothetical protein